MKPLIHKYNLTEKRYEDNRTIEDALKEVYGSAYDSDIIGFSTTLLEGKVRNFANRFLYALSREAIENYLKEGG